MEMSSNLEKLLSLINFEVNDLKLETSSLHFQTCQRKNKLRKQKNFNKKYKFQFDSDSESEETERRRRNITISPFSEYINEERKEWLIKTPIKKMPKNVINYDTLITNKKKMPESNQKLCEFTHIVQGDFLQRNEESALVTEFQLNLYNERICDEESGL